MDGGVQIFDQNGNFVSKVSILCEDVGAEIENPLGNDGEPLTTGLITPETPLKWLSLPEQATEGRLASLEWYAPAPPCRAPSNPRNQSTSASRRGSQAAAVADGESVMSQRRMRVPNGRPRFIIAYRNGNIQLMPSESCPASSVIVLRLPSTRIISTQWSPDGTMFAVSGLQMDLPEGDRNVLHFLNAEGERLQSIRLASGNFAGIAWESSGLRVGALIDTNIFLVVIKFPYKWAYCGQTLVYCYRSLDEMDEVLVFFETRMEIKTKRYLQNTCCIRGVGDQCLVVFRSNELRGAVRRRRKGRRYETSGYIF